MAQTPSWLMIAVRLNNRPASYLSNTLLDKITGVASLGTLLGGKFTLRRVAKRIDDIISGLVSGVFEGNIWITAYPDPSAGSFPTGTITVTSVAGVAGQAAVFTFGTVSISLLEAGAGASGAEQYNRDSTTNTVTQTAVNLTAKINAHPVLSGILLASNVAGVITLKSKVPGLLLQNLTIAATGTTVVQLTGGAVGVPTIFPQHVLANRNP